MNVNELIWELQRRGITLEPAGDKLRWRGPKGAMTPELLDQLRDHKAEVLGLLQQGPDRLFPYPLPETLALGGVDPLDFRYCPERRQMILDPGWWRRQVRH
ncbi:MAG: hypothetical protein AB1441_00900 [Bacillota bacterium]